MSLALACRVQIFTEFPDAILTVGFEEVFNLVKQVVIRSKVAEMLIPRLFSLSLALLHFGPIEPMKAVTLDNGGLDTFTTKNI
jgi:hypothetical protein